MSSSRITCAYLTHYLYWPGEALLACPDLDLVAFERSAIGTPEDKNESTAASVG